MDTTHAQSTLIAARIEETQQQILALEDAVVALSPEKQRLLGAEVLDTEALAQLDAQGTELTTQAARLHERLSLLAQQQEEAEGEEARERVNAIAARMQDLAREEVQASAAFKKAEAALTRAVERLAALHGEAGNIRAEMEFLHARYGAARQDFVDIGRLPNRQDSAALIFESLHRYWLRAEFSRGDWVRKLEQLEAARYKLTQKLTA